MSGTQKRPAYGAWLLALAAAAGTFLSIYNYLANEGIRHTDGALAVVFSCLVMAIAAGLIARTGLLPRWLRAVLLLALLLDVFATGVAGWFLETWLLMAFMAVALLGWLLHVFFGPRRARHESVPAGVAV